MIGSLLTRGLVMVFGYAYPAYECFKSVEKNKPDIEQLRFWCQYWILVAVLTITERIGDTFISWVPMYSEAKLAFYIYLWCPKTKGTGYVYDSFFRPYISKHEREIDRSLMELRTMAADAAVMYWQRVASYVQTRTFDILQYVASQSTPKPQVSKTRQTDTDIKGETAAHEETKEALSPAASLSSSSSSGSGSQEIEQSDAGSTQVLPLPDSGAAAGGLKVQKVSKKSSEAETMQIEPSSLSLNVDLGVAPKETIMEEPVRVTRARLRKATSLQ